MAVHLGTNGSMLRFAFAYAVTYVFFALVRVVVFENGASGRQSAN